MFKKQIQILPVIMALFLTLSYGQTSRKSTAKEFISDIRQIDFRNFSYKRDGGKKREVVQLRNGRFANADGAESIFMRIAYGDLNGDESEEAVILLRGQKTRVSRTLDGIFIYTLKDGKVTALAHFEGGHPGDYILSIESLGSNFKVENGLLVLDQAILREGEYAPTRYYTIKYRWNGFQMVETERSNLKSLPANMQEVG